MRISHNEDRAMKKGVAEERKKRILGNMEGTITDVRTKESTKPKPEGLNTVELLKHASSHLGIGPHDAMKAAEKLYLSGYVTYPRTESTKYPSTFDFKAVVNSLQRSHPNSDLKTYCSSLLAGAMSNPKKGTDAGDHPPITPSTNVPNLNSLSWDEERLYDFICRNFLATVSQDAKMSKTNATFVFGKDSFSIEGLIMVKKAFYEIVNWSSPATKTIPELKQGSKVTMLAVDIEEGVTEAPEYLSESELIEKMEKFGIGTDASVASHIHNICERGYVSVTGQKRRLVPSSLGLALCESYAEIDNDLVAAELRGKIEGWVNQIANGKSKYEDIVRDVLKIFKDKFIKFTENIGRSDKIFGKSFTSFEAAADNAKLWTKCGDCHKFMKIVHNYNKIICESCNNKTYILPRNAKYRIMEGVRCTKDKFE